jgi:hypothetical protein
VTRTFEPSATPAVVAIGFVIRSAKPLPQALICDAEVLMCDLQFVDTNVSTQYGSVNVR